jgi:hypothetical protein
MENKKTPWWKWILIVSSIFLAFETLIGGTGILAKPYLKDFIISVMEEQRGVSTKEAIADEWEIKKDKVITEFGHMRLGYYDFIAFYNKWTPHLQQEAKWAKIGYYVNTADSTEIDYHHPNGKKYQGGTDFAGLYYVRNGYKYR